MVGITLTTVRITQLVVILSGAKDLRLLYGIQIQAYLPYADQPPAIWRGRTTGLEEKRVQLWPSG